MDRETQKWGSTVCRFNISPGASSADKLRDQGVGNKEKEKEYTLFTYTTDIITTQSWLKIQKCPLSQHHL